MTTTPIIREMGHPLPWNRDKKIGVGIDFGKVPGYPGGYHTGIDMHAPIGEPVLAALDGLVVYAQDTEGNYGQRVDIAHGDELFSVYAHLNEIDVIVGQRVQTGQQIGTCGRTGNASGPHLHFEVRQGGNEQKYCVDPMLYIKPTPEYWDDPEVKLRSE